MRCRSASSLHTASGFRALAATGLLLSLRVSRTCGHRPFSQPGLRARAAMSDHAGSVDSAQQLCLPAIPDPTPRDNSPITVWVATPLRSVELPVWVDSPDVDSQAMLSAFLEYRARCLGEARTQISDLYMIIHSSGDDTLDTRSPVPWVACSAVDCRRCAAERGGYQFLWYHPRWAATYLRLARPQAWTQWGSWLCPRPDRQLAYSRGCRALVATGLFLEKTQPAKPASVTAAVAPGAAARA